MKGYVRNRNRPEGCIVEGYVAEESLEFCSEYLHDLEAIGLQNNVEDLNVSKGLGGGIVHSAPYESLIIAHQTILANSTLVQPYIE